MDDGFNRRHSRLLEPTGEPRRIGRGYCIGRLPKVDNIRVFFQEKNCGKGAALRRGFQEARGEVVVIQDADLELDPQEYPKLIRPIEEGVAEVVWRIAFPGHGSLSL